MTNNGAVKALTVKLGNKDYVQVAGRVLLAHDDNPETLSMTSEVTYEDDDKIRVAATVVTRKGPFTGHAESYKKTGAPQEKKSPLEVAETSAYGRALGFAGYAIEGGIASADEVGNGMDRPDNGYHAPPPQQPPQRQQQRQEPAEAAPRPQQRSEIRSIYAPGEKPTIKAVPQAGEPSVSLGTGYAKPKWDTTDGPLTDGGNEDDDIIFPPEPAEKNPTPVHKPVANQAGLATAPQVKLMYYAGSTERHLSKKEVDAACDAQFGCDPTQLSKAEASEFIKWLKAEAVTA